MAVDLTSGAYKRVSPSVVLTRQPSDPPRAGAEAEAVVRAWTEPVTLTLCVASASPALTAHAIYPRLIPSAASNALVMSSDWPKELSWSVALSPAVWLCRSSHGCAVVW